MSAVVHHYETTADETTLHYLYNNPTDRQSELYWQYQKPAGKKARQLHNKLLSYDESSQ